MCCVVCMCYVYVVCCVNGVYVGGRCGVYVMVCYGGMCRAVYVCSVCDHEL